jgi:heat shock protein HslJ
MKKVFKLTMVMVLCVSTLLVTSCNDDDTPIIDTNLDLKLKNTKWTFKAFNLDDELKDAIDGITVNLEFNENGKLAGSSGCNSYTGTYTVISGKSIAITAATVTLIDCEQDINTQEADFIDGLKNSKTAEIEGNQLRLYAEGGKTGLVLEKAVSAD